MDLATVLRAIQAIGPLTAAVPSVAAIINEGIAALNPADQASAKEAYADLIADNDDGHARVQAKLEEAARR